MYFLHIVNVLDFLSLLPFSNVLEICVDKFSNVFKLCLYFTMVYLNVFFNTYLHSIQLDCIFKLMSNY